MIEIHECKVSPLEDGIFLWANILTSPEYENVFFEKIAITQCDKYTIDYPEKDILVEFKGENLPDKKEIKIIINNETFDFEKYFYFVYFKTTGEIIPMEEDNKTECYCDTDLVVSVAANLLPLYQTKIKLLKEYVNSCGKNEQLIIDIILKEDIFKNSIALGEFSTSIKIWNELLNFDISQGNYKTSNEGYKDIKNNNIVTL